MTTTTPWEHIRDEALAAMSAHEREEYDAAAIEAEARLQLAELVYDARTAAGLSQTELARRAGTRQSVKAISAVSWLWKPIFSRLRPFSKPGVPSSTTMSEKPAWAGFAAGSVLATTITRPQLMPLEMKVFWPLIT